jgi:hypothetical protein
VTDAGREPVDLASLHAADALFDRLATRTHDTSAENDSTVRLLRALLEDVDGRPEIKGSPRGNNRRAACATAAMGVAAAVLATTGVAAATGGWAEPAPKQASVHSSKPVATKPVQPRDDPVRHLPAGRVTRPRPNPGPALVPDPSPAATQPETPGLHELGHESQQAVPKPTDIRDYLRRRLNDGSWR